mmetsp:Transcript_15175/g.14764  ORF Transcript_15175/g.14764 Transcript_15175/m.14764 type:complete len:140 (-) Transcript_15175:374-793(-)
MFSSVLSIILLVIVLIFPPILFFEAHTTYNKIHREVSKEVDNEDLAELKTDTRINLQFYFFFVMRRLILAITIVFCYSIPYAQFSILTFFISLQLIYLIHFRPFRNEKTNKNEIFNELCILAICYQLPLLTDYVHDLQI